MAIRPYIFFVLWWLLATGGAVAQEAQQEVTPFTVWIDAQHLAGNQLPTAAPIWLAAVTTDHTAGLDGSTTTIFQLQLRDLPGIDQKRLLRVFFEDLPGASPSIVGLGAKGEQVFARGPLGQALDLPTSETMVFSTAGIAALEIIVPGDGHNVRGVFLATLQSHNMMQAADFATAGDLIDVFDRGAALQLPASDLSLFGRVKATLDNGTVKLSATGQQSVTWEFELQAQPLATLVNFEVLDADGQTPLEITVNGQPLGAVTVSWPDLADPAYLGAVRPLEPGMRFTYSGWLRAQKMIPGSALQAGVNHLVLEMPADAGPMAVRNLELQLKHNWKNLAYTITPATP